MHLKIQSKFEEELKADHTRSMLVRPKVILNLGVTIGDLLTWYRIGGLKVGHRNLLQFMWVLHRWSFGANL
ncbi:hypothetical protein TIFTF001_014220 [Ficus carica]|uniref:Uncharacterized protein n=1 Tax=Ficus carica TaxID=3494 RepID=A0AA87ZWD6_FICCA|nr:hypothetical protein TIFTF001_014220 [Ficus carica]